VSEIAEAEDLPGRGAPSKGGADRGRRHFLQCVAAATVAQAGFCGCGLHPAFAAGGTIAASGTGPLVDPGKGYLVQQIGDALYWVTDGAYSTMFMVSSAGVVACDAPPTLGENYFKAIAEVTDKPVTHLVYSHEHVDHIAGAHLFAKDVTIVANARTAELLASRKDPRRPAPRDGRPARARAGPRSPKDAPAAHSGAAGAKPSRAATVRAGAPNQ
jgi:hypothetical protein